MDTENSSVSSKTRAVLSNLTGGFCKNLHRPRRHLVRSGGIASLILDVGSRWRKVISFTLRPLSPGREPPASIELIAS
jgi:hypothetical protein